MWHITIECRISPRKIYVFASNLFRAKYQGLRSVVCTMFCQHNSITELEIKYAQKGLERDGEEYVSRNLAAFLFTCSKEMTQSHKLEVGPQC